MSSTNPLQLEQPLAGQNPFAAHPAWQALQYHSVQVQFPDGSQFYLLAEQLALEAAKLVALPGISPTLHLQQQIMPLILESPVALLDIARRLTWPEMQALACRPFWRTPSALLAPRLKEASLSLHTLRG